MTKFKELATDVVQRMALRNMEINRAQSREIVAIVLDGLMDPGDAAILVGSMEVPAFKGTGFARKFARDRWVTMVAEIQRGA